MQTHETAERRSTNHRLPPWAIDDHSWQYLNVEKTSPPYVVVQIDVEEEFDWNAGLKRNLHSTQSSKALLKLQQILDEIGIVPIYLIDYPVIRDGASSDIVLELHRAGKAVLGTHLHSWVTPPFDEGICFTNSFQTNLPHVIEQAKLVAVTEAFTERFGFRPNIFKSGRYGLSHNTFNILETLGYEFEFSCLPGADLRAKGGPDFRHALPLPFWTGPSERLLSLPVTRGYSGLLSPWGASFEAVLDHELSMALRVPGLLRRLNILDRAKLTPEGQGFSDCLRLIRGMLRQGTRVFVLTAHSSSLIGGKSPYTNCEADVARLLSSVKQLLNLLQEKFGAKFCSLEELRGALTPV